MRLFVVAMIFLQIWTLWPARLQIPAKKARRLFQNAECMNYHIQYNGGIHYT